MIRENHLTASGRHRGEMEKGFFRITDTSPRNKNSEKDVYCDQVELRPGFFVSTIDLKAGVNAMVSYRMEDPMVGFGCLLSGDIENREEKSGLHFAPVETGIGTGGISYFQASQGRIRKTSGHSLKILHIHIHPETLGTLFEYDLDILPRQLQEITEGKNHHPFRLMCGISPSARSVACQIVNGAPPSVPQRIYLEGKALELISLQLSSYQSCLGPARNTSGLTHSERKKVMKVGDLLKDHLVSPPSLQELAAHVNLSINKLEHGFKEVFGMPVFAYIRESKMQKARLLFLETSMNVSEVAWEIGYVNVSHFSAAFKKRFGILPKHFSRNS